jgi:hypothetical protein
MRKIARSIFFLFGWMLSPFTWWNDALVNLPLAYLLASAVFYFTHLPFKWLILAAYLFTNILGLLLIFLSGRQIILSAKDNFRTGAFACLMLAIFSLLVIYLEKLGLLRPFFSLPRSPF